MWFDLIFASDIPLCHEKHVFMSKWNVTSTKKQFKSNCLIDLCKLEDHYNITSTTGGISGVYIKIPPKQNKNWFWGPGPSPLHSDQNSESIPGIQTLRSPFWSHFRHVCKFPENLDRPAGNSFRKHEILMASLAKVLSGKWSYIECLISISFPKS